jgi:outer membrane usher protein
MHGRYGFERAATRLTYDDVDTAIRYAAGEVTPRITGFQGSGTILGIAVAQDYQGIRPFENIRPSGRGGVTLDRPSTIIVETNGVETRRLRLDPGRYQLNDLSSQFGANDVRLIVEDDLGRHEVASAAFFTATAMLAGGLTDFGAALGQQEDGEHRYGGPITATGYVRPGFANRFTLGAGG